MRGRSAGADDIRDASSIKLFDQKLGLPMGTGAANYDSGDFGTSPFFERSRASRGLPILCICDTDAKAQGQVENLIRDGLAFAFLAVTGSDA